MQVLVHVPRACVRQMSSNQASVRIAHFRGLDSEYASTSMCKRDGKFISCCLLHGCGCDKHVQQQDGSRQPEPIERHKDQCRLLCHSWELGPTLLLKEARPGHDVAVLIMPWKTKRGAI